MTSTGEMLRAWERLAEWKRWLLCWFLIVVGTLLSVISALAVGFPMEALKGSEYWLALPAAFPIFAIHALIFSFVPRVPKLFSGILVVLYFLSMLTEFYNHGQPAHLFEAVYLTVISLGTVIVLWRGDSKGRSARSLHYVGMSFIAAGFAVVAVSGLVALGLVWGGMETLIGKGATWIVFWVAAPIGYLIVPLYELLKHGQWMPLIVSYVSPLIGALFIGIGSWISDGIKRYAS